MDILQKDPDVKAIFCNFFAGITTNEVIIKAIIDASDQEIVTKPSVIRMKGREMEFALEYASKNVKGLPIEICQEFDEAAKRAVELASECKNMWYFNKINKYEGP